ADAKGRTHPHHRPDAYHTPDKADQLFFTLSPDAGPGHWLISQSLCVWPCCVKALSTQLTHHLRGEHRDGQIPTTQLHWTASGVGEHHPPGHDAAHRGCADRLSPTCGGGVCPRVRSHAACLCGPGDDGRRAGPPTLGHPQRDRVPPADRPPAAV